MAPTTLTGGNLTVDTTTIASDESRRDNRLRSEGLQTTAPTASFTITTPVEIRPRCGPPPT
jgi:polyisoprenoid-binding protein YceI